MEPGVPGGTRPPDSGGLGSLPGSQAAVVLTSLHESREAGSTGVMQSGEVGRVKTFGAAEAPVQVEEVTEMELLEDKTPYNEVVRRGGRQGVQKQNLKSSTAETLAAGAPGAWGSDEEEVNEIGESQEVESNGYP